MGEGGGRRSLLGSVDITTEESLEPGPPAPALRRVAWVPWEDQRRAAGPPGPAPLGGRPAPVLLEPQQAATSLCEKTGGRAARERRR